METTIPFHGYLVGKLGTVPTEKDKGTVIETEKVVYKIEEVKNRHINKVKACKIRPAETQEEKETEEKQDNEKVED